MAQPTIRASDRAVSGTDALTLAALALTVVLRSSAFPGIRAALEWYSPGPLAILRNLVAAGAFVAIAVATHTRPPAIRDLPGILLIGIRIRSQPCVWSSVILSRPGRRAPCSSDLLLCPGQSIGA